MGISLWISSIDYHSKHYKLNSFAVCERHKEIEGNFKLIKICIRII